MGIGGRALRRGDLHGTRLAGFGAFALQTECALGLFGVLTHIQLPIVSCTIFHVREKDPQTIIGDRVPLVGPHEDCAAASSAEASGMSANPRTVAGAHAFTHTPPPIIGDRVPLVGPHEDCAAASSAEASGMSANPRTVVGDIDFAQLATHPLIQRPSIYWCEDDVAGSVRGTATN